MKTTEVFIAGGMPSVTYNPRTELGLENKLQDYLNTRHKLFQSQGQQNQVKRSFADEILMKLNKFLFREEKLRAKIIFGNLS